MVIVKSIQGTTSRLERGDCGAGLTRLKERINQDEIGERPNLRQDPKEGLKAGRRLEFGEERRGGGTLSALSHEVRDRGMRQVIQHWFQKRQYL